MDNINQPKVVSNQKETVQGAANNSVLIGVMVFTLACIIIGFGLVLIKSKNLLGVKNGGKIAVNATDPLAIVNPEDGLKSFLEQTLQNKYLPTSKLDLKVLATDFFGAKWEHGTTVYSARILTQSGSNSTTSAALKSGMMIVSIQITVDRPLNMQSAKNYLNQYFKMPDDSLPIGGWKEYDGITDGVGKVVAIKWQNYYGTREWRGMFENPINQKGPVYIYTLQACRIFPGIGNFENYKCVTKTK